MSDTSTKAYIAGLIKDARCFACYDGKEQLNVQTYLLAFISGLSTVPSVLAAAAKCLDCLTLKQLTQVRTYLYAVLSGNGTDPQNLLDSSTCYACIPPKLRIAVQTYLLTQDPNGPGTTDLKSLSTQAKLFKSLDKKVLFQIQVLALATIAGVSVSPVVLMNLSKCMRCLTEPELVAIAVQTLDFIEPIPAGSPRIGVTPPPVIGGGTRGGGIRSGGIPTCSDEPLNQIPVLTPVYLAGVLNTLGVRLPKLCCHPDRIDFYLADDASGTGAVFYATLSVATIHPGQANYTTTLVIAVTPTKAFIVARQVCSDGTQSVFSTGVATFTGTTEANDWATRVVANGGAMPSASSITAAGNFVAALKLAGIFSKMHAVNMFAPDSLIAAITPIIKTLGIDPWTNTLFVAGDLTTGGLKGDGATKRLNIGIVPSVSLSLTNVGMTCVVTVGALENKLIMAIQDGAGSTFRLSTNWSGGGNVSQFDCWDAFSAGGFVSVANKGLGYYSGNRTAANAIALYFAKTGTPHAAIATGNATAGVRPTVAQGLPAFCLVTPGPAYSSFTSERIPFMAVHQGLTATESLALFNAVQALRTAFGGGTV